MTTKKKEALNKLEPSLKLLGVAESAKEHFSAIQSFLFEIQKWDFPSGREIEIAESYKEIMNQLTHYSLKRIEGQTNEQLANEIQYLTSLLNGFYELCHPF